MEIVQHNTIIDQILSAYKTELAKHFEKYKNHVYRVYNLTIPYLSDEEDKKIMSIAAAFHDLGIWTNKTFNYLIPSVELARRYSEIKGLNQEKILEIGFIINEHHKLTGIKTSQLAEIFRQADLIDLTLGAFRKGRGRRHIKCVRKAFPNKGFHWYLLKIFLVNLVQHPLKPLPMYKI
jgi:hypothetical protein